MKHIVLGLAALLFVSTAAAQSQQAPATQPADNDQQTAPVDPATQTTPAQPAPTVPVKKVARNNTPIILGAIGAAALIGAAGGGGGSDNPAPPSKPSSP